MKLIFLGPPGVGKGTYASRIGPQLGIAHISTGDLLRSQIKEGTDLGIKAKEFMDAGNLVPDDLVINMLKERITHDDCDKGFILDGFPRTIPQAEELEKITNIEAVVNIKLADDVLVKKIAARRVCKNCGDIYNIIHIKEGELDMPPLLPIEEGKCDKCKGELFQRDDDNENVVRDRLKIYKEMTSPLIEFYEKKGLIIDIHVVGGPDIMVPNIISALNEKI